MFVGIESSSDSSGRTPVAPIIALAYGSGISADSINARCLRHMKRTVEMKPQNSSSLPETGHLLQSWFQRLRKVSVQTGALISRPGDPRQRALCRRGSQQLGFAVFLQ